MSKIVLGFSGGVDSAVSAVLLKQCGREVIGVFLDNGDHEAVENAVHNAETLEIPLHIVNIEEELEHCVCKPFVAAYHAGKTPIPCVICNPTVKFHQLVIAADRFGAEQIATGHYARAENGYLYKGRPANDQSYMLNRLTKEQVTRAFFPLGNYEKAQVREMAKEFGIPAASRPDSQEICFIPNRDYRAWLRQRGEQPVSGEFYLHGEFFGAHEGIQNYTVGQRLPDFYQGRKLYVAALDAVSNRIELALWEELFHTTVHAECFQWLAEPRSRGSVRVRHTKWEEPKCTVNEDNGIITFNCDEPVRAPAPGQSAVLYEGDLLLGGGTIL